MLDANFYNLTQSLWGAFGVAMRVKRAAETVPIDPLPILWQLRAGYAESPGWFMVQAGEFDPEPLTVADLRVRDTYASESLVAALLEMMASEKWFDRQGKAYFLTAEGRTLQHAVANRNARWLAQLKPLPQNEMQRLERLFGRLIEASLQSPAPPGIWCLAHSRNRAPNEAASLSAKIFHYVADFNAFRDDAHMAAWQPLGIDGRTWEAFNFVQAGGGETAESLYAQLAYRGYSRADYGAALTELAERGWVAAAVSQTYQITPKGQVVFDAVEQLTNDYFFGPWSLLSNTEINEVEDLIVRLRDALQAMAT